MKRLPSVIVLIAAAIASPAAHAYLDPSTGSMIVTAIVGLFASIALALKTYWYKLKAFFRAGRKKQDSDKHPPAGATGPGRESGD